MKLIIPMAGNGSRFANAGYVDPKPFIKIFNDMTMIETVLRNLKFYLFSEIILLVRKEHLKRLAEVLERINFKNFSIITIDSLTEGAACTLLHAYSQLDTDEGIVIANSDQLLNIDIENFLKNSIAYGGSILCFIDDEKNKKWSYCKCNSENIVLEVAEKNPISDTATVGVYFFKNGKKLLKAAVSMISKNIRTNNEFYICPIYNEYISLENIVKAYIISKNDMHGLGTPEDLELFLKSNKEKFKF